MNLELKSAQSVTLTSPASKSLLTPVAVLISSRRDTISISLEEMQSPNDCILLFLEEIWQKTKKIAL
jgi:hypothetical protein